VSRLVDLDSPTGADLACYLLASVPLPGVWIGVILGHGEEWCPSLAARSRHKCGTRRKFAVQVESLAARLRSVLDLTVG
jgi:hypothetical protein